MTRRRPTPTAARSTDWTGGAARHAAAGALLLAAIAGLIWTASDRRPLTSDAAPALTLPDRRIDVNAAGAAELRLLPGIGPALSERIAAERESGGPFRDLEDLQRVGGIGPRTAAGLEPHVVFGSAPPANAGGGRN